MANGKLRWDVDVLRRSINMLSTEKENLRHQRSLMEAEHNRVDANWKSPAGQQYQNRLQNDMACIDNILEQLEKRLSSLQKVLSYYSSCEIQIQTALNRLPY